MPMSGSYYYPVMQRPQASVGGGNLKLVDGVPVPLSSSGNAVVYIDSADGDLKITFADGVTKTIATDT